MTRSTSLGGRQFFLDWVRVLAFALLIFYHTGMMFVSWDFHIESGHDSELLKSIMMLSSSWRLDILFLVSGVAISFMISKMSLRHFASQRVIKLLIPFLFAVVVVVAPQAYFEALHKGVYEGGFWEFWTSQYFSFSWPEKMLAPFPTYNHMWYVLYLFAYTLLLLPLFNYINSERGQRRLALMEHWLIRGRRVIWLPILIYCFILICSNSTEITHAFYNDAYGHAIYLFALLMGLLFVRMPLVWQAFENHRHTSLVIALIGYSLLLTERYFFPVEYGVEFLGMIIKWSWMTTILGYAKRYLNSSNSWLEYASQAVYPFFILHQTVIIVIGYFIIDLGFSWIAEFVIIALGTFLICGLIFEGCIKRLNILKLMFGLKYTPFLSLKKPLLRNGAKQT